jgi:hypothetical protein
VNTAKRDAADLLIFVVASCPLCGETSAVRPKLDEAWVLSPGKDSRLACFADLRVDDVQPQNLREHPLEQFIDGFYCDRCNKGLKVQQESSKKLPSFQH